MPISIPMDYRLIRSAVHRGRFDILSDCRSHATQAKYRAFRATPSTWASTEDRLKHVLFNAPVLPAPQPVAAEHGEHGPAEEQRQRSGSIPADAPAVLVPNDFPYYTTEDVQHLVLWAPFELTAEFVTAFLDEHLPGEQQEVSFFVNPPQNKTVPGIEHCHVFVRSAAPAELAIQDSAREVAQSEEGEELSDSTTDSDGHESGEHWTLYSEPTLRGIRRLQ